MFSRSFSVTSALILLLLPTSVSPQGADTRAFELLRAGDVVGLTELAKTAPDALTATLGDRLSVAHYAAHVNSVAALRVIASVQPQLLQAQLDSGATPAYLAAQNNHIEALRFLAERAPESISKILPSGATAAHVAARNDNFEALAVLELVAPGLLRMSGPLGDTIVHSTVKGNALYTLTRLPAILGESATAEILQVKNEAGRTPFELAVELKRSEAVSIIEQLSVEGSSPPVDPWPEDCMRVVASPAAVRVARKWYSKAPGETNFPLPFNPDFLFENAAATFS